MSRQNYLTIKLDIDKPTISNRLVKHIDWCIAFFKLDVLDIRRQTSASGNNHIELDIRNPINDYELVFLQLLMGSDHKRECFNLLRVHSGSFPKQTWNILFKNKFHVVLK